MSAGYFDSSETTFPSEHSSVYDAVRCSSSDHSDCLHERTPLDRTGGLESPGGTRFINRPHGTPLETIVEQKSCATLKTKPSVADTKRIYSPIHCAPASPYAITSAPGQSKPRRTTSFSVNDLGLYEVTETMPKPPSGTHVASESLSLQPPRAPPRRTPTPEGFPRWPGDLPTSAPAPRGPSPRPSLRDLFHAFLAPSTSAATSNAPRPPLRSSRRRNTAPAPTPPARTGRAYWRPPRSGQVTTEDLHSHPFHDAPIAAVRSATAATSSGPPTRPAAAQRAASARASRAGNSTGEGDDGDWLCVRLSFCFSTGHR